MNSLKFTVDNERCTGCESCVLDCPPGVMAMENNLPVIVNEQGCMRCLHCFAICPTGAITILGRHPDDATPLHKHLPSFKEVRTLIKGRRSIRSFKTKNVDARDLTRLLDTTWHAPTGHNSQSVQLTVVDDAAKVARLAAECFTRLQQLATEKRIPDNPLGEYLQLGLTLKAEHGLDIFFRGAPHLLITSAPKNGPSPQIDTVISLAYFELAAQAMGLGTLWNGLVKAMICDLFPDMVKRLGVPEDHQVGYVMVFGKPAVRYQRTVDRGPAKVHLAEI